MNKKYYSKIYRLMHWLMAITFILLLMTILLRMGWMNKYNMAEIVQDNLRELGRKPLSYKEAKDLGKAIREPMWHWHFIFGYILIGLIAIRFLLPAFGKMKFKSPLQKNLSGKEKCQRWIYLVFYGLVIISLFTGVIAHLLPQYKHDFYNVDIHKLSIYYLIGYIVIHLINVLWAEYGKQKGIVSGIISGGVKQEKQPDKKRD